MTSTNRTVGDVDGCMLDFVKGCSQVLGEYMPKLTQWDFISQLPKLERQALEAALSTERFWEELEPMPGALTGVRKLQESGGIIVCSNPWVECRAWEHIRRDQLWYYFGIDSRDILFGHRKELVRGRQIIDDRPAYLLAWKVMNPGKPCWLYAHDYNESWANSFTRFTWADMPEEMLVK